MILSLVPKKGKKGGRVETVTKFVGIIVTISYRNHSYSYNYFHVKISPIARKNFATQCFFHEHFKRKSLNKANCRKPSAKPCQLCAHYLNGFKTVIIIFRGFQNFLIYLVKYFLVTNDFLEEQFQHNKLIS